MIGQLTYELQEKESTFAKKSFTSPYSTPMIYHNLGSTEQPSRRLARRRMAWNNHGTVDLGPGPPRKTQEATLRRTSFFVNNQ